MNPKYIATIGGVNSGTINRGAFIAQQGVAGHIKITSQHWEPIEVTKFSVLVIRDSLVILRHTNTGNKFEQKLIDQFAKLQVEDRILIFDIWADLFDKSKIFLQPLEYKLQ